MTHTEMRHDFDRFRDPIAQFDPGSAPGPPLGTRGDRFAGRAQSEGRVGLLLQVS